MTDPEWADATYLEPLDARDDRRDHRARAARRAPADARRPDRAQPGPRAGGGRRPRALGVELIGADLEAIRRAEDRAAFRDDDRRRRAAGARERRRHVPRAARRFPCRRSCGRRSRSAAGGGLAHTRNGARAECRARPCGEPGRPGARRAPRYAGWREFKPRSWPTRAGNCVIVCSIENIDPMGIHTGDSWTVAPQQRCRTRNTSGCATPRSCVRAPSACRDRRRERAVRPTTGRHASASRLIEMNPRVSRSSALASKATGFPIPKLAALLAVGYTLDETSRTTSPARPRRGSSRRSTTWR